jgi:hypothetical protein
MEAGGHEERRAVRAISDGEGRRAAPTGTSALGESAPSAQKRWNMNRHQWKIVCADLFTVLHSTSHCQRQMVAH